MQNVLKIDTDSSVPLFQQIKHGILQEIKTGTILVGDKLPSINSVCKEFGLSPGTVTKAYEDLRKQGLITSKQGKGYYIAGTDINTSIRIFLLFDRLNAYKEILFDTFMASIGKNVVVDVFFHHYDINRFEKLIIDNVGNYTHYVVMPHFHEDVKPLLQQIPIKELYLLDRNLNHWAGKYGSVYQDFEHDVIECLTAGLPLLKKYNQINLIRSESKFQFIPNDIIKGFSRFCEINQIKYQVLSGFAVKKLKRNQAYLIFPDNELIAFLKFIQKKKWLTGQDIGVISYDDTPMKELLMGGITTITTDFTTMGMTLAKMIKEGKRAVIANPARLVIRKSL